MADYIPVTRPIKNSIETPLTLTTLQTYVGGFIKFVELRTGDLLIINEASLEDMGFYNTTASQIAGMAVYGDVVICDSSDIA